MEKNELQYVEFFKRQLIFHMFKSSLISLKALKALVTFDIELHTQ